MMRSVKVKGKMMLYTEQRFFQLVALSNISPARRGDSRENPEKDGTVYLLTPSVFLRSVSFHLLQCLAYHTILPSWARCLINTIENHTLISRQTMRLYATKPLHILNQIYRSGRAIWNRADSSGLTRTLQFGNNVRPHKTITTVLWYQSCYDTTQVS